MVQTNQNSAFGLLVNIHFNGKLMECFHALFAFLYVTEKSEASSMI